jgi:hypothetical protein
MFILVALWCVAMTAGYAIGIATLPQRLMWSISHGSQFVYRFATGLAIIGFSFYCLVRFVQRRRQIRRLMLALSGTTMTYALVFCLLPRGPNVIGSLIIAATWAVIGAYFLLSKRVKNTFVR